MQYVRCFIFFMLVSIFYSSHGLCGELGQRDNRLRGEKIYIQPNQIHIESDGIFVNLSNQWFVVEAVYRDAGGVYINDFLERVKFATWNCPVCGHINYWYENCCSKCGHR